MYPAEYTLDMVLNDFITVCVALHAFTRVFVCVCVCVLVCVCVRVCVCVCMQAIVHAGMCAHLCVCVDEYVNEREGQGRESSSCIYSHTYWS